MCLHIFRLKIAGTRGKGTCVAAALAWGRVHLDSKQNVLESESKSDRQCASPSPSPSVHKPKPCGSMFDSVTNSASVNTTVGDSEQCGLENPFSFTPFTVDVVREALTKLDPKKPAGPDNVEPFFLKIAADFIAPHEHNSKTVEVSVCPAFAERRGGNYFK